MTWGEGRAEVEAMLESGALERVPPDSNHASRLLREAEAHLRSAVVLRDADPAGAYQLAYDGARKASAALLAEQGLRSTTAGGHRAVQDTVNAQFAKIPTDPFGDLARLRRRRHDVEYPRPDTAGVSGGDVDDAVGAAQSIADASSALLGGKALTVFDPSRL